MPDIQGDRLLALPAHAHRRLVRLQITYLINVNNYLNNKTLFCLLCSYLTETLFTFQRHQNTNNH